MRVASVLSGPHSECVDDCEPGVRRDGLRQPILVWFGLKLLEDRLGNDDPVGERGKKIEARDPTQQDQRRAVDGKASTHPQAPL